MRGLHFAVAAAAAVVAYLGYKICVWLVGPDAPGADRGAFTHDVAGKAEWFGRWALYGALNLFDVTWSAWLAALVAAVAAGGIVLWLLRRASRPLLFIALGGDPRPAHRPAEPRGRGDLRLRGRTER